MWECVWYDQAVCARMCVSVCLAVCVSVCVCVGNGTRAASSRGYRVKFRGGCTLPSVPSGGYIIDGRCSSVSWEPLLSPPL